MVCFSTSWLPPASLIAATSESEILRVPERNWFWLMKSNSRLSAPAGRRRIAHRGLGGQGTSAGGARQSSGWASGNNDQREGAGCGVSVPFHWKVLLLAFRPDVRQQTSGRCTACDRQSSAAAFCGKRACCAATGTPSPRRSDADQERRGGARGCAMRTEDRPEATACEARIGEADTSRGGVASTPA